MGLIGFIIAVAVTGAIVGGLARLALPGPDPMSIGQTILVGIGGSLGAGLIVRLLSRRAVRGGLPRLGAGCHRNRLPHPPLPGAGPLALTRFRRPWPRAGASRARNWAPIRISRELAAARV